MGSLGISVVYGESFFGLVPKTTETPNELDYGREKRERLVNDIWRFSTILASIQRSDFCSIQMAPFAWLQRAKRKGSNGYAHQA